MAGGETAANPLKKLRRDLETRLSLSLKSKVIEALCHVINLHHMDCDVIIT